MAPEIKHGLVMTRQVSLDFQCRYDTSIDDISAERTIIGGSISSGLIGRDTWPGFCHFILVILTSRVTVLTHTNQVFLEAAVSLST